MKILIPALIAVTIIGIVGTAHAGFNIQDSWTASYQIVKDGVEFWFFNPDGLEITSVDPSHEFEIKRVGPYDVVFHEGNPSVASYLVNGNQTFAEFGYHIPAVLYLDSKTIKLQNEIDLLQTQVADQQEIINELDRKISKLEKKLEKHQHPAPGINPSK